MGKNIKNTGWLRGVKLHAACVVPLLILCPLVLTSCVGVQSSIDPVGTQARQISHLWWFMIYLLTAIFLIVMAVLMIGTFRRRSETEPTQERTLGRAVIGGVVITIIVLFALLITSFLAGRSLHSLAASESHPLTIDVTGLQWWWQVKYESDLPSQMVTTANEIHIPVGRLVRFKLRSNDVIHSFWVPNLHGKTDLIPGHIAETWIKADRVGTYRGQCAEFCGHQHAHMALLVVVENEEQFQAWYSAQVQSPPQPATETQVHGQQIFTSTTCAMCHRVQGTDAGGSVGPELTHVASRQTIAAGTLPNTRENLAKWILDPQSFKPGTRMPQHVLNSEDLQAVVEYLQTLR